MSARARPSSRYNTSYGRYRGQCLDDNEVSLASAGFVITKPTPFEWELMHKSSGLVIRYFPTKQRFQTHGKNFTSNVPAVIRAVEQGRIRPASDVNRAPCKLCGEVELYWMKSPNDKWMAIEFSSGAVHFSRCERQKND